MQEHAMSHVEVEKIQAENNKLLAEALKLAMEADKLNIERRKLIAEADKLKTETGKMSLEIFWYPVAIAIGMFGTAATVTALIIKFL